jgi:hypothetical protein
VLHEFKKTFQNTHLQPLKKLKNQISLSSHQIP